MEWPSGFWAAAPTISLSHLIILTRNTRYPQESKATLKVLQQWKMDQNLEIFNHNHRSSDRAQICIFRHFSAPAQRDWTVAVSGGKFHLEILPNFEEIHAASIVGLWSKLPPWNLILNHDRNLSTCQKGKQISPSKQNGRMIPLSRTVIQSQHMSLSLSHSQRRVRCHMSGMSFSK